LKTVQKQSLAAAWEGDSRAKQILAAMTPPTNKRQQAIELKIFSGAKGRKNSGLGWQTLQTEPQADSD
jgi:hypothetical protein